MYFNIKPSYKRALIYQRFFLYKNIKGGHNGSKDDVTYIHTTYEDNKDNLSESFLTQIYDMKKNTF